MESIEKHKIKIQVGTMVVVVLFCISLAYSVSAFQSNINSEIDSHERDIMRLSEDVVAQEERIRIVEDSISEQNIKYAEIQKDLMYIRTTLDKLEKRID